MPRQMQLLMNKTHETEEYSLREIDLLVKQAFEAGDKEQFLRHAEEFERLTGEKHLLIKEYLALVEEANSLSDLCCAMTEYCLRIEEGKMD